MTIQIELLNSFYKDIYENFGEEIMVRVYQLYQGLTVCVPKKMYDPNKLSQALILQYGSIENISKKDIIKIMRKYDYSERQVYRLLKKDLFNSE